MKDFKIEVDVSEIASAFSALKEGIEKEVHQGVQRLAMATHARAMELADEKLKSTKTLYKDALSVEPIGDNIWVVALDMKKAGFIEDGRKSGFQKELLYGKSSKINKEGKRYAIIPFQHNKNPSEQGNKAQQLSSQVKEFLAEKKLSPTKLEFNPDGSPKMGLLHRFDVKSDNPSSKARFPALHGLAIYQRKGEKEKVQRQVMTFRIISEDMEKDGRWVHPGRQGVFIIDEVYEWALGEWDNKILPEIMDTLSK